MVLCHICGWIKSTGTNRRTKKQTATERAKALPPKIKNFCQNKKCEYYDSIVIEKYMGKKQYLVGILKTHKYTENYRYHRYETPTIKALVTVKDFSFPNT